MTPAPVVEVCKWLDETDSSPCGGIMISHQFPIKQLMITSISMKFTSWYQEVRSKVEESLVDFV